MGLQSYVAVSEEYCAYGPGEKAELISNVFRRAVSVVWLVKTYP